MPTSAAQVAADMVDHSTVEMTTVSAPEWHFCAAGLLLVR
jgi:hypothetical protein